MDAVQNVRTTLGQPWDDVCGCVVMPRRTKQKGVENCFVCVKSIYMLLERWEHGVQPLSCELGNNERSDRVANSPKKCAFVAAF